MKITEPAREIDVVNHTDVLVVGSGPGGLAAALAAARCGVQVTLVERFGCFGGNLTVVDVEGFAWYRHEQTVEADGIGRQFEERTRACGTCKRRTGRFRPAAARWAGSCPAAAGCDVNLML
jgi:NADPH-dependent 2,4-dienoyl-CoA reductase/sulfur reductase-like enzyme